MLAQRWASVADNGPTLNQHWVNEHSTRDDWTSNWINDQFTRADWPSNYTGNYRREITGIITYDTRSQKNCGVNAIIKLCKRPTKYEYHPSKCHFTGFAVSEKLAKQNIAPEAISLISVAQTMSLSIYVFHWLLDVSFHISVFFIC